MKFLETNTFLRYLTNDHPIRASRCRRLFRRIHRGDIDATTSEVIVAEIVYVLGSTKWYNQSRDEIRDAMVPLLLMQHLRLPDRWTLIDALDLFVRHRIDFADALAASYVENHSLECVVSYDTCYDKIPGVRREEP